MSEEIWIQFLFNVMNQHKAGRVPPACDWFSHQPSCGSLTYVGESHPFSVTRNPNYDLRLRRTVELVNIQGRIQ